MEIVDRYIFSYCYIYGISRAEAKQKYLEYLTKGYNALQTQKDKYRDVLKKVVEKIDKVKAI